MDGLTQQRVESRFHDYKSGMDFGENRKGTESKRAIKQVTRGHNIVADGWAGASNPHPYPIPLPTLTHTKSIKNARFPTFQLDDPGRTDGRTDGPTDRRTDKASYRVACPQLKI